MAKITPAKIRKFADQAGISIGANDGSPYPSMAQLNALIRLIRHDCSKTCRKIGMIHQQKEGTYAAGLKAGAYECADALDV